MQNYSSIENTAKRMETCKRIGAELALFRREKGLTQREAAAKIGIDNGYLAKIEKGRYAPSVDLVDKIAEAYGYTIKLERA